MIISFYCWYLPWFTALSVAAGTPASRCAEFPCEEYIILFSRDFMFSVERYVVDYLYSWKTSFWFCILAYILLNDCEITRNWKCCRRSAIVSLFSLAPSVCNISELSLWKTKTWKTTNQNTRKFRNYILFYSLLKLAFETTLMIIYFNSKICVCPFCLTRVMAERFICVTFKTKSFTKQSSDNRPVSTY